MEDEEKFFYESQKDFFGEESPNRLNISQPYSWFQDELSPEKIRESPEVQKPPLFKAYNPMDDFKNVPEHKQQQFMYLLQNKKTFNGIQHFFNMGQEDQHRSEFLQNIESDAFEDHNSNNFQLDKLFRGQKQDTHKEALQSTLLSLHERVDAIHHKMINSLNINRAISNGFYEHFENFTLVLNSSNFFNEFEHNFKNTIQHCKKIKGPGSDLFTHLYEFWNKSFKDLINEVWRYSSKFTLSFFKKNESPEGDSISSSNVIDIRSESSNTMGSKEKRKGWNKEETECLRKCIDADIIFTQSILKNISTQLGRSVSSVSSKIQKLIKARKGQETQEDSLFKKTIEILKMEQQGLTRQTIIQKLNEHYEMGYGGQWQKSVGQLLSSKKEFIKIRGKHRLIDSNLYVPLTEFDDGSKLTFKDKVVQILLLCPEHKGQLRVLVEMYIQKFGQSQLEGESMNEQRRKTIEGNISKTLSRYDIFDNSNSKTKYLLNPLVWKNSDKKEEMDVENFLSF